MVGLVFLSGEVRWEDVSFGRRVSLIAFKWSFI